MRSRLGIFSVVLLLTPSCFSISCRTCKDEQCFNKEVLIIACNRNIPILPFQAPSYENKDRLQYGCLKLKYKDVSVSNLQQCILAEDLKEFCTSIRKTINVIRCNVTTPQARRFKREGKILDSKSTYQISSFIQGDESSTTLNEIITPDSIQSKEYATNPSPSTYTLVPSGQFNVAKSEENSQNTRTRVTDYRPSAVFQENLDEDRDSPTIRPFNSYIPHIPNSFVIYEDSAITEGSNENAANNLKTTHSEKILDFNTIETNTDSTTIIPSDSINLHQSNLHINLSTSEPIYLNEFTYINFMFEHLATPESDLTVDTIDLSADWVTTQSPITDDSNDSESSSSSDLPTSIDLSSREPTNSNDGSSTNLILEDSITTLLADVEENLTTNNPGIQYSHEELTTQMFDSTDMNCMECSDEPVNFITTSSDINTVQLKTELTITTLSSTDVSSLIYLSSNEPTDQEPEEELITISTGISSESETRSITQVINSTTIDNFENSNPSESHSSTTPQENRTPEIDNFDVPELENDLTTTAKSETPVANSFESTELDETTVSPTNLLEVTNYTDINYADLTTTETPKLFGENLESEEELTTISAKTSSESETPSTPRAVNSPTIDNFESSNLYESHSSTTPQENRPPETDYFDVPELENDSTTTSKLETLDAFEGSEHGETTVSPTNLLEVISLTSINYADLTTTETDESFSENQGSEEESTTISAEILTESEIPSTTRAVYSSTLDNLDNSNPHESYSSAASQENRPPETDYFDVPELENDSTTTSKLETLAEFEGSEHGETTVSPTNLLEVISLTSINYADLTTTETDESFSENQGSKEESTTISAEILTESEIPSTTRAVYSSTLDNLDNSNPHESYSSAASQENRPPETDYFDVPELENNSTTTSKLETLAAFEGSEHGETTVSPTNLLEVISLTSINYADLTTTETDESFSENQGSKEESTTISAEILTESEIPSTTQAVYSSTLDNFDNLNPHESYSSTASQENRSTEIDNFDVPEFENESSTTVKFKTSVASAFESSELGETTVSSHTTPTPARSPSSAPKLRSSLDISVILITLCLINIKLR